jgi:hypothetical protein
MPELYRSTSAAISAAFTPTAAARWEPWASVAVVAFLVLLVGGGLMALNAEYRSGWVASQQVSRDKAAAIHRLMFREE